MSHHYICSSMTSAKGMVGLQVLILADRGVVQNGQKYADVLPKQPLINMLVLFIIIRIHIHNFVNPCLCPSGSIGYVLGYCRDVHRYMFTVIL